MRIKRRTRGYTSHSEATPAAARIVSRWPNLTTRIVRDRGLLWVEYARRADLV